MHILMKGPTTGCQGSATCAWGGVCLPSLPMIVFALVLVNFLTKFVRNLTRNDRVAVPVGEVQIFFAVELQAEIWQAGF